MVAMLPSSELDASGRLQALQQIVEYSELGPLVQVTYFSLLIHIYVHCYDSKARLCGFASLRALKRVRKWAHGFRTRGKKCLRVLTKSLHGMASAAMYLKAYHRRSCFLRCGSVLCLPCKVLESLPVGVTPTSTRGDNDIPARVRLHSIFCDVNSISSRGDNSSVQILRFSYTLAVVTMRSPLRDRAPEE